MMFLERNLEQLTVVQRQLVEQNSSLKKEVAIAERKLIARNERIQSLEQLLQDSQEKLTAANHRYVDKFSSVLSLPPSSPKKKKNDDSISLHPYPALAEARQDILPGLQDPFSYCLTTNPSSTLHSWTEINKLPRFEAQLTAVKERLEAAKQGSTRGLGSSNASASFAYGGAVGSRVAKPIRGGAPVQDGPVLPVLSNLQAQEAGAQQSGKRTSWFFKG